MATWVHSHQAKPVSWEPDGNGWQLRDNNLEPVMFENDAAPKEVRDLTHTIPVQMMNAPGADPAIAWQQDCRALNSAHAIWTSV